jgi:carboxypeptidase PM20D1
MRRVVGLVAAAGIALGAVLVWNALGFTPRALTVAPPAPLAVAPGVAGRHAAAIRFRTVSSQEPAAFDPAPFAALREHLAQTYPRVHAALARELVAGASLLYTWPGRDAAAPPLLLLAHQDVVPVDPATEAAWTHPAFAGDVADGFVWGRGAIDDKLGLTGVLEACEALLAAGFTPRRTILLAFGHDEEIGGRGGAAAIAERLASRGVRPALVLDEGLPVSVGLFPGVARPLALIGVAEKGYLTLELTVEATGGHSSRPPRDTAIGILARGIARLEAHPAPAALAGPVRQLLDAAGREMPFWSRLAVANLWLFGPLVVRRLEASPDTNALVRTTTAPTMLAAGVKENVLPVRARAVVNFRILPGDTVASTTEHARAAIDDARVRLAPLGATLSEPSPAAPTDGVVWQALTRAVGQVYPEAAVGASLVVGATDSRHYAGLTDRIYRFLPVWLTPADLPRVHGIDERVAVADVERAVRFYAQVIRNLDATPDAAPR